MYYTLNRTGLENVKGVKYTYFFVKAEKLKELQHPGGGIHMTFVVDGQGSAT